MNDLEQRLTAAMTARTELVTEESLTPRAGKDQREKPPTRRWPVLVAAAAAVLVVAGVVAASGWYRADPPAKPPPPPPVLTTGPTTGSSTPSSAPPPTSAPGAGAGTGTQAVPHTTTTEVTPEPPTCGGRPCTRIAQAAVAGDTVELWAAEDKADWQIRVGGVVVPGASTSFAGGVRCWVVGRPVCLVSVWDLGDSDASVGLEKRAGQWRHTGATFVTPYGATSIEPRDLYANGSLEVVSVETMNDTGIWTAQVWRWDGSRLGCGPRVDAKEKLPGWPTVTPDVPTLAIANCFGG